MLVRAGVLVLLAIGAHVALSFGTSLTYVVTIEPGGTRVHVAATAQGLRGDTATLALKGEATYVESYISNLRCGSRPPTDAGQGRWTVQVSGGALSYEYDVKNIIPWHPNVPWGTSKDIGIYVDRQCGLFMAPYLFVFPDQQEFSSIRVKFVVPTGWQVVTPFPFDGEFYVAQKVTRSLLNDFLNRQQFYMGPMRFYAERNAGDCVIKFGQLMADENVWELDTQEEVDAYADATAKAVLALSELFGTNPYGLFTMYTNFRSDGWTYQGTRYLGNGYQYWPEHRWDQLTGHLGLAWARQQDAPLWVDARIEKGIIEDYYGHKLAYELFDDSVYRAKMLLYYYLYEWMREHPASATSSHAGGIGEYEAYVRWEFVALLLDEIIQERSGGTHSLDDAMRWLFTRYSNTEYVVGISDLEWAIQAATNVNVGDVFSRYAYGTAKLPVYDYIKDSRDAFLDYPRVLEDVVHNRHYHGHILPMFIDVVLAGSLAPHIPWGLHHVGYAQTFAETILDSHDLERLTEGDVTTMLSQLAGQDCSDFFHAWEDSFGVLTMEQVKSWLQDYLDKTRGQTPTIGESSSGRILWDGVFVAGSPIELKIEVYDSRYAIRSGSSRVARFVVKLSDLSECAQVMPGEARRFEWGGFVFLEKSIPLSEMPGGWEGLVIITPCNGLEEALVMMPPQEDCPYFGLRFSGP